MQLKYNICTKEIGDNKVCISIVTNQGKRYV